MYTDEEDHCKGYLLIAVDNTKIHNANRQLIKAEKALTENLVRLSLILETGEIYPWYMDVETGKLDISEDFYKFFGLNKEKQKNHTIQDFMKHIHPEDLEPFREKYESLQMGPIRHITLEFWLNINGKGFVWCEMNAETRERGQNS